jgi:hypothetical protein
MTANAQTASLGTELPAGGRSLGRISIRTRSRCGFSPKQAYEDVHAREASWPTAAIARGLAAVAIEGAACD